jgi:processing peptidase subunit alpha
MFRASVAVRSSVPEFNFGQSSLRRVFGTMMPIPRVAGKANPIEKTVCGNGVTIISKDDESNHTAIGVYIEAGPKFDPLTAPGISQVLRLALMTSNMENSLFQVDRSFRAVGHSYGSVEIRKRYIALKTEGRRDKWLMPFQQLATGIVVPRFAEEDIERFRDTLDNELEEQRWQQPRQYAVDQLETVAFLKEPLGMPRRVPDFANDKCSSEKLLAQWSRLCKPKNVTIAGVNVKHDELLAAYTALPYPHSEEAPHFQRAAKVELSQVNESVQFCPGKQRFEYEDRAKEMGTKPNMDDEVVIAVGWPTFGRDESAKAFATASVVSQLLSMKLASPGVTQVSNSSGASAFYRPYSTAGLLGVVVVGSPYSATEMLKDAVAKFPKSATDGEVAAAIARATVAFFTEEQELVRDQVDFIATSKFSSDEILDAINSVKNADVNTALSKIRAVEPSAFATGKIHDVPSLRNIGLKW